ncbi:MAG: site-2 protease family protein [Phycisphaerae bacterium]|nr:site-2 protease family protein [Phycisphaerae bacterium]
MSWRDRPYADGSFDPPGSSPRFVDNPLGWSLALGRISGIQIRAHFVFILFIVLELLTAEGSIAFAARWLGLLFSIVLLHELGHCLAARRVGGDATEILMWPLGGLAFVRAPQTPFAQFITTAGGPLVNVALCLVSGGVLVGLAGTIGAVPLDPFRGWAGASFITSEWHLWLYLAFRVSYVLLLFNLIPMYPLDGGRLLQAALWPVVGLHRSMELATSVGMIGAVALGLVGAANGEFMLIAIAVFGYMTCLHERRLVAAGFVRDEGVGFGAAEGHAGPTGRSRGGWLARWRRRRLARQAERDRARQIQLDEDVDRILLKVHREGIQTLTRAERRTLEQATRLRQETRLPLE